MTCPCCWRVLALPGSWSRRRTRPFWGAGAGRQSPPGVRRPAPWRWKLPPAVCGRSCSRRERAAEAAEACGSEMQVYPAATARRVTAGISHFSHGSVPFDPADAWSHVPISLTSAASRWPFPGDGHAAAGGHNVPARPVRPAPANPCWPAACPASCRLAGKKPWRRRKFIPSPGRCPQAGAS